MQLNLQRIKCWLNPIYKMRKHEQNKVSHLSELDHFPPGKNVAAYWAGAPGGISQYGSVVTTDGKG